MRVIIDGIDFVPMPKQVIDQHATLRSLMHSTRKSRGMTLEGAAKLSGLHRGTIDALECGGHPYLDTIARLARAYDLDMNVIAAVWLKEHTDVGQE